MSLLPSTPDFSSATESAPRVVGVDDEAADELIAALSSSTARQLLATLHEDPAPPSRLADEVDTSLQNVQYHLGRLEEAGAVQVVGTGYSEKGREMDVYGPADEPLVLVAGTEDDTSLLKSALSRLLGAVAVLGIASLVVQELYGQGSVVPTFGMTGGAGGADSADGGGSGGGDGGDAGGQATDLSTKTTGDATTTTAEPTSTTTTADGGGAGIAEATETATRTMTETTTATQTQTPTPTATPTEVATAAADTAGSAFPPGLLFFLGGLLALVVVLAFAYTR